MCRIRNRILTLRDKSWANHFTKTYSKKNKKFLEKIEDKKQLQSFLKCLTYASNFIKALAKLRKPLQHKLKKEVSWTWNSIHTKIVQNLKKMCKNLAILNLPNEEDDWILETGASNEHWSLVLKLRRRKALQILQWKF